MGVTCTNVQGYKNRSIFMRLRSSTKIPGQLLPLYRYYPNILSLSLSLSFSLSLSLSNNEIVLRLSLIWLQTICTCRKYYSKSKSSPIKSFLLAKSRKMDCKDKPRTWQCTYFISQIHIRIMRKGLLQSQTIKI